MILDSPDQSVSSETPVEFGDFHLTKDDWLNLPNGALLFKSYEKYLGDENLEQLEEYKEPVTSQDASMDEEESLASSETIPEENGNEGNRGALPSSEEIFERILLKFDEEDVVAMATKLGQTLHKISEDHQEDDVHDLALAGYFSSTMEEEYDQEVMGEAIVSLEKPKYPVSKIRKKQTELISRLSRHFMKNRHEVSTSSSNNSTETEDSATNVTTLKQYQLSPDLFQDFSSLHGSCPLASQSTYNKPNENTLASANSQLSISSALSTTQEDLKAGKYIFKSDLRIYKETISEYEAGSEVHSLKFPFDFMLWIYKQWQQ